MGNEGKKVKNHWFKHYDFFGITSENNYCSAQSKKRS